MTSPGSVCQNCAAWMTASPEAFMNVCGSISATFSPPTLPSAISAPNFVLQPSRSSMCSVCSARTARQPALCRVRSYFDPGLPRPTINFTLSALLLYGSAGSPPGLIDLAREDAERRPLEPEIVAEPVLDEPQEARVQRFLVLHHDHERRRFRADLRDAVDLRAVALLAEPVAALREERV